MTAVRPAPTSVPVGSTVAVVAGHGPSLVNFRGSLLDAMVKVGYRVVAFAPNVDARTADALEQLGVGWETVPIQRAAMSPVQDMGTLVALTRVFRSLRPDVVLTYTIKPVVYGSLAAQRAGVARTFSMVTGLGYPFSGDSVRQRFARGMTSVLLKRALRLNEVVFFQNHDDVDVLRSRGVLSRDARTVVVAGSGVDLDHFACAPFPSGETSFLLMTRLLRNKGVYEYVEAARRVRARHPNVRFRILGWLDANPNSVTREELQAWEREGAIEYLGAADDVRPHLAAASVVVLPSFYREGIPRSIVEAMAVGRAVVTTDAPGCRETVVAGRNGVLVPPKDAGALAETLQRLVESPDLVLRMGKEGRRLAEERFDVQLVNAAILEGMGLVGVT